MQKYAKFITALVGVAIAAAVRHFGASNEWVQYLVLLATSLGVYTVPNKE